MRNKRGPQRRCIVCRQSSDRASLLRFVFEVDRIVLDRSARMEGRGAYLHPSVECWSRMAVPGLWERALRRPAGTLKGNGFEEAVEQARMIAFSGIDGGQQQGDNAGKSKVRL